MRFSSLRILMAIACLAATQIAYGQPGKAEKASGPLRVHPQNPRYFADAAGRAVYLTGSHTWDTLQDMGETDPPAKFDYDAYLDFLTRYNHNFIRLWRWDLVSWDTHEEKTPRHFFVAPHPWARTGPGNALDGKPKFDLTKFDEDFFDRLRTRVAAAGDRGIYVSVMLHEGWGLWHMPKGWQADPFHPANNINGTGSYLKADMPGMQLFTLASPKAVALQEAYVRKVIDTVNDLDNVLYEIANESDNNTTDWQYHMIRFIKKYESTKPKQHPVGMTSRGGAPGNPKDDLDRLLKSPADWISPTTFRRDYMKNPPAADGAKIILSDTDHLWGIGGDASWVWKTFLRGLHPLYMDAYQHRVLTRFQSMEKQVDSGRRACGHTRVYANKMNLAAMTPRDELASSKYCLANPGHEYLVFIPGGGSVTVDLSAATGELKAEWMHPVTGAITVGEPVKGGAKQTLKAPFTGDAVLYVSKAAAAK